jgi:hypothetical protein
MMEKSILRNSLSVDRIDRLLGHVNIKLLNVIYIHKIFVIYKQFYSLSNPEPTPSGNLLH